MKYLIEVPDGTVYGYDEDKKILIFQEKDFIEASEVSNLVYLPNAVPYEEPDRKAIEDEAWEFARKVECMGIGEIEEAFDIHRENAMYPFNQMSYKEAKRKYEAWKKSKEEICIGDEIKVKGSSCADAVVIGMDDYDLYIVWKSGETDRIEPPQRKEWVKTGKHFSEVEELLKKITEKSNED